MHGIQVWVKFRGETNEMKIGLNFVNLKNVDSFTCSVYPNR